MSAWQKPQRLHGGSAHGIFLLVLRTDHLSHIFVAAVSMSHGG